VARSSAEAKLRDDPRNLQVNLVGKVDGRPTDALDFTNKVV